MLDFLSDVIVGALPNKALIVVLIAFLYVVVIGGVIAFFLAR